MEYGEMLGALNTGTAADIFLFDYVYPLTLNQ